MYLFVCYFIGAVSYRTANKFLKKQLDNYSLTLKVSQEDHSRQMQVLQAQIHNSIASPIKGTSTPAGRRSPLGSPSRTGPGSPAARRATSPTKMRQRHQQQQQQQDGASVGEQQTQQQLHEMSARLHEEQRETEELRVRVEALERERAALLQGWRDVKSQNPSA